jgi:hypothetical protein
VGASLVDDHSRLAYSELHRDERALTVTGFVERGLAFYAAHGIEPKRLLSDNAFVDKRSPSRSAVTLAPLLQHAQTAQLTRRPATDQPCPQPPEARQLAPRQFAPRRRRTAGTVRSSRRTSCQSDQFVT